LTRRKWTKK
jgi:hypothetical protein